MIKPTVLILLSFVIASPLRAQFSQQDMERINKLTSADHNEMLEKLGIASIRRGPSGNPKAPDAANNDEAKVQPYFLPDPLVMNDGSRVTKPEQWPLRRAEIQELLDREMYGRLPDKIPAVNWKVVSEKETADGEFPVKIKQLEGVVDNSSYPEIKVVIQLTLGTPAKIDKPVPVIMEFGFDFSGRFPMPQQGKSDTLSWKQQLLKEGWGYAILNPNSFQADNGAGLRQGIIGLVNKGQPRKPDDWGCLRAWAWGAGRAMDYFQTDKDVDARRIGIEGLSRYGKAAAVAMAYEPRIAIGFIGSSGAGGVKLLHRVFGEQVENLAGSGEYHWFAANFIKYAGPLTQEDLPVDGHSVVAMCAPRPVFISSGSASVEGQWVDAKGMFLGGAMAGPVYELLGKKSMRTMVFPPQGTWVDGDIAFRQHEGGHTTGPNWPYFIEFAKRYFLK
ncbi:MAG: acetylxylan esterase [Phycisphaerae bacterium]|nr:acetylxylan esterase [Phycisphaerae bacterium]